MIDFKNIDYLSSGNELQKQLYHSIVSHQLIPLLQEFDPIVVGTIPIDIAITGSDVDILLYAENLDALAQYLETTFGKYPFFHTEQSKQRDLKSLNSSFALDKFIIEIFAQPIPTDQQMGYLHMVKEYQILLKQSPHFKEEIIRLKREGMKTEPAFAHLLGLEGDPYLALLNYHV